MIQLAGRGLKCIAKVIVPMFWLGFFGPFRYKMSINFNRYGLGLLLSPNVSEWLETRFFPNFTQGRIVGRNLMWFHVATWL